MQNPDLAALIRHARSPGGALLAIAVLSLVVAVPIIFAVRGNSVALYGTLAFFGLLVAGIAAFIMRRTPKGAEGLTATEDYYTGVAFLKHLRTYGRRDRPLTRAEVFTGGPKEESQGALNPPSAGKELPGGTSESTMGKT